MSFFMLVPTSRSRTDATDPYWGNVSLLLEFEGTNGDTTFTDLSQNPKSVTRVGNSVLSNAQKPYGATALLLDGDIDYLDIASHVDFGFGTGDFTIEYWVFHNNFTNSPTVIDLQTSAADNAGIADYVSGTTLNMFLGGVSRAITGSDVTGAWKHIAYCRSGTSLYGFFNGIKGTSFSDSTNCGTSKPVRIGKGFSAGSTAGATNGYIKGIRITKGVARYSANFTPNPDFWPVGS